MDRTIDIDKKTIKELLEEEGWKYSSGGNFFLGGNRPHLHLIINHQTHGKQVDSLRAIVPDIDYLGLTFDDFKENIDIIKKGLVQKRKIDLQDALKKLDSGKADELQAMINNLTGLGVNYKMDKWR